MFIYRCMSRLYKSTPSKPNYLTLFPYPLTLIFIYLLCVCVCVCGDIWLYSTFISNFCFWDGLKIDYKLHPCGWVSSLT